MGQRPHVPHPPTHDGDMPIPRHPGQVTTRCAPERGLPPPDSATPPDGGPVTARLRDPGELAAVIPMLLGFHPGESLVVVAFGGSSGNRIGLTARADLPSPVEYSELADEVACSLLHESPAGAAVVVVSSDDRASPPHGRLVALVRSRLDDLGIELRLAIHVHHTGVGAPWRCYGPCRCSGLLPDPATTPFAAVMEGRGAAVHPDRSALECIVQPADPLRIRRRELLLMDAADAEIAGTGIVAGGDRSSIVLPVVDPDIGIAALDAAIAEMAATAAAAATRTPSAGPERDPGEALLVLDDHTVVALATALALPEVYDAAVLRSVGPDAEAVERLWATLAREMPDPEAAEPSGLLVFSAMLRGDLTLARIALERAESAWPGYPRAAFLRVMVESALGPSAVRACVGALLSDEHTGSTS
ncbi:DUF4192 domain-containing protein [Actinomycetes bacterium KLBMP 9759]